MKLRKEPSENPKQILSAHDRPHWYPVVSSIWARHGNPGHQDPVLTIVRTLCDQPRWIEPANLYDKQGSQLFEAISELPEYYLTRTEEAILRSQAKHIIALAPVECVVELGSGSSTKTTHLLSEQVRQRRAGVYVPIDVSLPALIDSRKLVQERFPEIVFQGLCTRYEHAIRAIDKVLPKLLIFLGSTVGNFTRLEFARFFQQLVGCMGPKDFFLLGVDQVKEVHILQKAYADSEGLTARFILNAFQHINRTAGSNFDLHKMRYCSEYSPRWQRMEMYAVSTCDQEIHFPGLKASFWWRKDERILVEISRKFDPVQLQKQLQFYGLEALRHFVDAKRWFSLLLFRKSVPGTNSGKGLMPIGEEDSTD